MVPTHVDVAIENTKEKCKIMAKKKIYTKEELLAKMPKKDEQVRGMVFL